MISRLVTTLCFVSLTVLWTGCDRTATDQAKTSNAIPSQISAQAAAEASAAGNMVSIAAGRFVMGDKAQPDAKPHEVEISAFHVDKYLVTQDQYQKIMGENPSRWKGTNNPVEQVRWSDAVRFCNKRSEQEGLRPCYDLKTWKCDFDADGYRLPTEAEWEYACRAGASSAYCFGDDSSKLGDYAWFDKNSGGRPRLF